MPPSYKIVETTTVLIVVGAVGWSILRYVNAPAVEPIQPTTASPNVAPSAAMPPGATSATVATPGAAPPAPEPATFDDCLEDRLPAAHERSSEAARKRVDACARAIQSRRLDPRQLAHASLNRGIARMALGDAALASEDYLEALKHYDGAIDPRQPEAMDFYRRGAALEGLGKTDSALEDYDRAVRLDPKSPLAYYARGVLLATRQRAYQRAVGDFDKVLALAPDNVDALIWRGDAQGQLGDFGHAIADLDRAVALAPERPRAYVYRGLAHSRRGEPAQALADFDAALRLDPRNADALRNRGALHAAAGRVDLALADLNAAIALQPEDAMAFYNRGYANFGRRQYEQAVLDYSSAIALQPTMGLAYNNRCLARAIVGRELVAALADCDTALKLTPYNLDVRETRGFIYLKLGDPAIAQVEYDAVLQVDVNRSLALYGRGLARIRMGKVREGEDDQAAARILNPAILREFAAYDVK